jgi:hypothetical protein
MLLLRSRDILSNGEHSVGAGKFTIPTSEDGSKPNAVLQHFFDGLGILHKFTMSNGQVRATLVVIPQKV